MKTIACYPLHYGLDYLAWSIRSVQDVVDEIHVFYTSEPSFGHGSGASNPDSHDALYDAAHRFANKQIHWHTIAARTEGQHRDMFLERARERGADLVLAVDADEVWDPKAAETALRYAYDHRSQRWLARFSNFFRSWRWQVYDQFRPVRIHDVRSGASGDSYFDEVSQPEPVLHFGYAQSVATVRYKWTCHGHQNELLPGWIDKFSTWNPEVTNLHPTSNGVWDRAYHTLPERLEKLNELMPDHPHRDLEIIP